LILKTIQIKKPQQQRSKAKFDAVLEALPRVIAAKGYKKTTTAEIALEADISVGSLYDYFSSKEAILIAYLDQHLDNALDHVAYYAEHSVLDWQAVLKELVRVGVQFANQHKIILQTLFIETPELLTAFNLQQSKQKTLDIAASFASNKAIKINHNNIDLLLYSITNIVLGFQFRLALLGDGQFSEDAITDELAEIISAYLAPHLLS
jgi:AcrR family transcriptional regulator